MARRRCNSARAAASLDFVQCPRDSGEQLVAEGVQLRRSVQRENRHSAAIVALQDTRSLFARGVHYNMQLPAKLMVQVCPDASSLTAQHDGAAPWARPDPRAGPLCAPPWTV